MYTHIPEYFARIVMIHTHDSNAFCIFACVTFVRTQSIIITYTDIQWIQVHPSTFLNMFGVWNHHIMQNYLFVYHDIYI